MICYEVTLSGYFKDVKNQSQLRQNAANFQLSREKQTGMCLWVFKIESHEKPEFCDLELGCQRKKLVKGRGSKP